MASSKPLVAVDCDEVLAPLVQSFCAWYNRVYRYGDDICALDFRSYFFTGGKGPAFPGVEDDAEAEARVNEFCEGDDAAPEFTGMEPLTGALDVLRAFSADFRFVIVTARSQSLADSTRRWLERHFPGLFEDVIFTNAYGTAGAKRSKGDVCASLGAIALIDDSPRYAMDAASKLPLAFLFGHYAWNRTACSSGMPAGVETVGASAGLDSPLPTLPSNVVRLASWREVSLALGVLKEHLPLTPAAAPSGGHEPLGAETASIIVARICRGLAEFA